MGSHFNLEITIIIIIKIIMIMTCLLLVFLRTTQRRVPDNLGHCKVPCGMAHGNLHKSGRAGRRHSNIKNNDKYVPSIAGARGKGPSTINNTTIITKQIYLQCYNKQ